MTNIYVRKDRCIRLGPVSCDGFQSDCEIRVQTHAHSDHENKFIDSMGLQKRIVLSQATFDLLAIKHMPMRKRRSQFVILPEDGTFHRVEGVNIALFPSNHMIGSVMPCIEMPDGTRCMYTGDFNWPISARFPEIDTLVVDATYGSPSQRRQYNRDNVINEFHELLDDYWSKGSIVFKGHKGNIQFISELIASRGLSPIILGPRVAETIEIFFKHKNFSFEWINVNSDEAKEIIATGKKYIALLDNAEHREKLNLKAEHVIWLSNFGMGGEPIAIFPTHTRVALTDHADFDGTIELIQKINPRRIIADGTIGDHAEELVAYVRQHLSLEASCEVRPVSNEWGR